MSSLCIRYVSDGFQTLLMPVLAVTVCGLQMRSDVGILQPNMCFAVCRFLYDLSQIPSFVDRCFCLLFQSTFSESVTLIDSRLNNVRSVIQVTLPLKFTGFVFSKISSGFSALFWTYRVPKFYIIYSNTL